MDILSARKKAAAKKKTKKRTTEPALDVQQEPAEALPPAAHEQQTAEKTVDAFSREFVVPRAKAPAAELPPLYDDSGETTEEPHLEMLAFRIGTEEYAVTMAQVREVLTMRDITPVPNTPDPILGVTTLRGVMLPVIDLCKRLGIAPGVRDEKARIIVVSIHDEETGLVVDRVTGTVKLAPDTVKPAPDTIEAGAGGELLQGIARKDDKLYVLLDLEKVVGQ